jgi:hypothetical protein
LVVLYALVGVHRFLWLLTVWRAKVAPSAIKPALLSAVLHPGVVV